MNSRAAINDLLPFQGSPFSHLGTSPKASLCGYKLRGYTFRRIPNGEGGIRTHVPLRTNGFQDRLVMTTSIPLQVSQVEGYIHLLICEPRVVLQLKPLLSSIHIKPLRMFFTHARDIITSFIDFCQVSFLRILHFYT